MKSILIPETADDDEDEIEGLISEYSREQPGFVERTFFTYKLFGENDGFIAGAFFLVRAEWLSIFDFIVIENQRGKGYGKHMLKEIEAFAKSKGCSVAEVGVEAYHSYEFFIKNGFEIKYTREFDDKRLNHYQLVKILK